QLSDQRHGIHNSRNWTSRIFWREALQRSSGLLAALERIAAGAERRLRRARSSGDGLVESDWPREAGSEHKADGSAATVGAAEFSAQPDVQGEYRRSNADSQTDAAPELRRRRGAADAGPVQVRAEVADVDFRLRATDCVRQSGQPDAGAGNGAQGAHVGAFGVGRSASAVSDAGPYGERGAGRGWRRRRPRRGLRRRAASAGCSGWKDLSSHSGYALARGAGLCVWCIPGNRNAFWSGTGVDDRSC